MVNGDAINGGWWGIRKAELTARVGNGRGKELTREITQFDTGGVISIPQSRLTRSVNGREADGRTETTQ